ncbi:tyrosine-type recombinase/integrase [Synechococcus sp. W70.1]|uniref:tyrosine-type recombinase/integrase n=1 Tax=Synechococcus sp. W70.1 TaxID=2964534 RepID=UPI0039C12770
MSTRYISLREARSIHFTMRQQLAHGQDPKLVRQAQQLAAANTFALVAEEWLQINREKWVPSHTKTIRQRLNKNILPWLGSRPIGIITPSEILEAIRRIEARGAHETARRCLSPLEPQAHEQHGHAGGLAIPRDHPSGDDLPRLESYSPYLVG